jgi:CDP-diacylglycerol--glycerol-3-phosphate 3-phosphatidyltransferase
MNLTFATKLTLIRLILSPLIIPLACVYLLPYNALWLNAIVMFIFLALSLTDFFDGYLARRYQQQSSLGAVLDPIADKFLMFSVLISLLVVKKIFFVWVLIILGREFFMMGLRQVALESSFSVPVSGLGKLKTALQVVCFSIIIANPYQAQGFGLQGVQVWNAVELVLLALVAYFSIYSAFKYYYVFMKQYTALKRDV